MLVTFMLAVTADVAPAQPRVTIEPMMAKGPESAAVTIVEFSDFQ